MIVRCCRLVCVFALVLAGFVGSATAVEQAAGSESGKKTANAIGRALAVSPAVWVEQQGQRKELVQKDFVYLSDVLAADATGKAQIMFTDNTTVSIAPNTRIHIAEFVYNDESTPSFAMNITNGVARVVTGMIVKKNPEGFKVVTPQAVIGIRGTDCTIISGPDSTKVVANRITTNDIQITNAFTGQTTSLAKTGMTVETTAAGTMQRPATESELSAATQATRRQGEQQAVAATSSTGSTGSASSSKSGTTSTASVTARTTGSLGGGSTSGGGSASGSGDTSDGGSTSGSKSSGSASNASGSSGPNFRFGDSASGLAAGSTSGATGSGPATGSGSVTGSGSAAGLADSPSVAFATPPVTQLLADNKVVPPTPSPQPPVAPAPAPQPIPDPVPPVVPPVTPDPTPVPPVTPPVEPPVTPPVTPDPAPVPPVTPPVTPDPAPVPPVVPPSPSPGPDPSPGPVDLTGKYSGSLMRGSSKAGDFTFNVNVNSGQVTKAALEVREGGKVALGAYEGAGNIDRNNKKFTVNWGTTGNVQDYVTNKTKVIARLHGGFKSDGSVDSLKWEFVDQTDPGNKIDMGSGSATLDESPLTGSPANYPATTLYGGFSGDLRSTSGAGFSTGSYRFNVELNSGEVSEASLKVLNASRNVLFGAYGGTATIDAEKAFSVTNWDVAEYTATPGVRIPTTMNGQMLTDDNGGRVTGLTWQVEDSFGTVKWQGDSHNHNRNPALLAPVLHPVTGTFYGYIADESSKIVGAYQLNVDAGTTSGGATADLRMRIPTEDYIDQFDAGSGTYDAKTGSVRFTSGFTSEVHLSGKTITGMTWAKGNKEGMNSGFLFDDSPLISVDTPNPKSIFGYFSGKLNGTGVNSDLSEFSFKVEPGKGSIENAAMKVVMTDGNDLFSGSGGAGTIAADLALEMQVANKANSLTGFLTGQFDGAGKLEKPFETSWFVVNNSSQAQANGTYTPDRDGAPLVAAP